MVLMSVVSSGFCIPGIVSPMRSGLEDFLGLPPLNLGQHYSAMSNKLTNEAESGHKKVPQDKNAG